MRIWPKRNQGKRNRFVTWIIEHKFWSLVIFVFLFYLAYYSSGYYFVYNNDAYVFAHVSRVAPVVSGRINKVYVKDNEHVKQGQILVELDQAPFVNTVEYTKGMLLEYKFKLQQLNSEIAELEADINVIKAELNLSNLEWERYKKLLEQGAASSERFDVKRANYRVMEARLIRAEQAVVNANEEKKVLKALIEAYKGKLGVAQYNLKHSKIYADKDGYINHLRVYNGDFAKEGEAMFGFVEQNSWQIIADIKSDNLPIVKPGKTVWVYISSRPWHIYEGKIKSVGRAVARNSTADDAALPYVKPVLSWIRYPYRVPVLIDLVDWPIGSDNDTPLYMGTDARVIILP
ncbi:HlyD family secretion protein [Francisellaceae bacterium]|nr:HlyD family secretion protein [Francisellaceae bacterium]